MGAQWGKKTVDTNLRVYLFSPIIGAWDCHWKCSWRPRYDCL